MKALDEATAQRELQPYLNRVEIKGLLGHRDRIVAFFEQQGSQALYDRPSRTRSAAAR
jgi:hypothetical protein